MTELYKTRYNLDDCSTGIVHLGYGAFHRAHQSVVLDDYMEATGDLRWGITAVNLRSSESDSFANETGTYLLRTTAPDSTVAWRRVRPHLAFVDWSRDTQAAEELLTNPDVHVVTITVTESGYGLAADFSLNTADPSIAAELAGEKHASVYAYLAAALARRAQTCDLPINILCCDNIRSNGNMLRAALMSYLELTDRDWLADWCRQNACFPNAMVDRITPKASEELLAARDRSFPEETGPAIHSEDFLQWVIEDNFIAPFPELGKGGAEIVADVEPFEETKIRVLNGGHSGLAYLGALAGHETFDCAMRDDAIRPHFDGWEREDVLPGLPDSLPFDKTAYFDHVARRFENAAIADQLARICMDGWFKMPIYVRPTVRARLQQGAIPTFGFDVIASWYVFARRVQQGALTTKYVEPYWDTLVPFLSEGAEQKFASNTQLWSDLPESYGSFVPGVLAAIARMEERFPVESPLPEACRLNA
jgi:D-arabinitol 4-dehydrogenase